MQLHTSIIHAYLHDQPLAQAMDAHWMERIAPADPRRKEVVAALLEELQAIVDTFPVYNASLWKQLFPVDELKKHILVLPVVGSTPCINQVLHKKEMIILQLDLIHIADYTRILSQMVYIMKNYLTKELAKLFIEHRWKQIPDTYLHHINYICFRDGLANLLAWNEDAHQYPFASSSYEARREQCFALLYQALQIHDPALQKQLISHLMHAELWEHFAAGAGMLYLYDILQEQGENALLQLLEKGPRHFAEHIFQ